MPNGDEGGGLSSSEVSELGGDIGSAVAQLVGGSRDPGTGSMLGSVLGALGSQIAGDVFDAASDLAEGAGEMAAIAGDLAGAVFGTGGDEQTGEGGVEEGSAAEAGTGAEEGGVEEE